MGKIVLLDDLTINKIAAGEVIERPASCVKEMCENSIDAGAKNITVEIRNGGISLIKIVDDGCGISEDDMEMAFERHATSKIRSSEDLVKVTTMGFRGEALASIAAISNIEMISKRPEDEIGHRIVVEGGKILEKGECGAPNGTSITVKNLFFNTPVRYKFLKKDFTEAGYIEDAITRLALINKDVAIKLINTGKTDIQTTGNGDIKTVVYSIYGKDVADGITEVEYTYEDIKVTGVVGNTSIARSNRNGQVFFVNNRYVKDKTLTSAVDQAYKDILMMGKYGFVILNLEMDPSKVDCNVHPAKLEVRFEEEQKVFKAVYHAIKSKNEEIMARKTIQRPEIEKQEKIFDDEPEEQTTEREEFKPREGTFSGFFKMFKKEEKEEEEKNTLIEELYQAKQNGGLSWKDNNDSEVAEDFEKKVDALKEEVSKTIEELEKEEKIDEEIEKSDEELAKELEELRRKADELINSKPKEEAPQEVKLGNTIISSDTKPSAYNVEDLMKAAASQETMKIDTTKLFSADNSKTEVIDSIKKIDANNNRETVILDTEIVRNEIAAFPKEDKEKVEEVPTEKEIKMEELSNNTIAERLLEQKVKNDMDDTQFIDTGKVRNELRKTAAEDDTPVPKDFANMYKKVFGMDVSTVRKTKEEENAKLDFSNNIQIAENISENLENETVFEEPEAQEEAPSIPYRYIGTIFDTYAIIEVKDEMYMIEKNAAEERLMYEVVKENYENEVDDSVSLLLADIVTLSPKEMSIARDLSSTFQKAGFEYDEFGESTLKLTKVPSWAERLNTKKLFLEILREMDTVAVTATKEKEDKFIATVSNKFVELSDTKLTDKELEDLIRRLLRLPSPFMYPNGRLTAVKISRANMEKKFSRR
ncbi:MAG: DNA mismatch repair endonuclease MutL [Clostridia bacterium]|nr:DNA mismatch repair endonuclease MutL [Clostridia bacterium]